MKRAYIKPELFCEEYELSVDIAGNCSQRFSNTATHNDPETCTYQMMGDTLFVDTNSKCTPGSTAAFEEFFCYVGTSYGDNIVFAS